MYNAKGTCSIVLCLGPACSHQLISAVPCHLQIPDWCEPEWRALMEMCWHPNPEHRPPLRQLGAYILKMLSYQPQQ